MPYKHRQVGYVIIFTTLGLGILIKISGESNLAYMVWILGLLFSSLKVIVNGEYVHLRFGPGWIQKRILLNEIDRCQITQRKCCSWGIHGWPGKGWLYNVSGFRSVELIMKNGMKYYIGTDQPAELEKAINEGMHRSLHRSIKIE